MKKRLVSLLLVLIMVLGMLPTTVFAADAATESITTAEQFAKMDAEGSYRLDADITITAPYEEDFYGSFDGNGHKITLNITSASAANVGVFSTLRSGALVENLTTDGTINVAYNNVGAIAGQAAASTKDIIIRNCRNEANITADGKKSIGGIVGYVAGSSGAGVKLSGLANTGAVSGNRQVGGIIGNAEYANNTLTNAYNHGAVTGTSGFAGICGRATDSMAISNCYTTGTIKSDGYALAGLSTTKATVTLTNCYALEGCGTTNLTYSSGITATDCGFKTEDDMKSQAFAALLGGGFTAVAGAYPTLKWEVPTAPKTFTISPAEATLIVKKGDTEAYRGTGAQQTVKLAAGEYTYTVSCPGYVTQNGEAFTVTADDAQNAVPQTPVSVTLLKDENAWTKLTVTKDPADTAVTILNGVVPVQPQEDGSYLLLKEASYTYTAKTASEGYEDLEGAVDLTSGTLSIVLPQVTGLTIKAQAQKTEYLQGDALDTTGLILSVSYRSGASKEITADEFTAKGVTTAFESSKPGTATVTLSYKGVSATYQVEVKERPDVFAEIRQYADVTFSHNTSFKGADGEEFVFDNETGAQKSNSAGQSNSQVWVTIKWNNDAPTAELSLKYKVSTRDPGYSSASDGLQIDSSYSKIGGEVDWTEYTKTMTPGLTLTLKYVKGYHSSYYNYGSDCIWLKDFTAAPLYTLTLETNPSDANAELTLTSQATGKTVSGTNGKYTVTSGQYDYVATAFGYETAKGTVEVVDKDKTETISLKALPGQTVTFDLTLPESLSEDVKKQYTITIKSGSAVVRTLTGENTTTLPDGSYTYTVTHPNCASVSGSFEVKGSAVTQAKELTRVLVFSDFFEGIAVTAADDSKNPWTPVESEEGNYLMSVTGYNKTQDLTLTATDAVELSFDTVPNGYDGNTLLKVYLNDENVHTFKSSTQWETYRINLKKDDKLRLHFETGYNNYSGRYVYLKNFQTAKLATVNFTLGTEGATIRLTGRETGAVYAYESANGAASITIPAGSYSYTVSKFGFADKTGEVTLAVGDTKEISVPALETLEEARVMFDVVLPGDCEKPYSIEICKDGKPVYTNEITEGADEFCTLPVGTYTYTVSHAKCEDATDEFTLTKSGVTLRVKPVRKLLFEDFFAKCGGITAKNDTSYPYKPVRDESGDYLITEGVKNYQKAKITLTADKALRLSFSYYSATADEYEDCPFTVAKGYSTLLKAYDELSWKTFTVDLAKGDTLTLSYEQPYSSGTTANYHVKLKDFRAETLSKITFSPATEGTAITVKNAAGEVISADKDGGYTLSDGSYTYTASLFGYKSAENVPFTVKGAADTVEVAALEPLPTGKITFTVDQSDATVTVTHATQGTQTANEDGTYTLVQGETYTYTVSKADYVAKTGAITVSGDRTITVKLTYAGTGWDGTTKTAPSRVDGVYQLSNAAELAWFADEVNNGSVDLNAALTANINLNGRTWTGIGAYNNQYAGTFDGNNHVVSGLVGKSGLFDYLAGGTIRNLVVSGAISGGSFTGLLAGVSAGTVENCFTMGSILRTDSYGANGGLIGRADKGSVVRNSGSSAKVSCSIPGLYAELNMGGLIGNLYGTVENSYATGSVTVQAGSGYHAVGGFIGQTSGENAVITNCYAAGSVTGVAGGTFGAFLGDNKAAVSGCFYREGAAADAVASGSASGITALEESYMKSADFIKDELGIERYHVDADDINGGYPIHAWQGGTQIVVSADEKAVTLDVQTLKIYDQVLAKQVANLRKQADAEVDEMLADLSLSEINDYLTDNFGMTNVGFKTLEEARAIFRETYYRQVEADYLEENGKEIDLDNTEGLLTPDNDGVYHIKTSARLRFTETGDNGSRISWTSNNTALDTGNGQVTLPASGTVIVTLTATAAKGSAEKSRDITAILYSAPAEAANVLSEIAEKLSANGVYLQPVQIRGHENAADAVSYWLYENGYDDEGISVRLTSPGVLYRTDSNPYIAENGELTYYRGEADAKYVTCTGVTFELSMPGATQTVTANMRIGWDVEYAKQLMQKALDEALTWQKIRGANENEAVPGSSDPSTGSYFAGMVVEGEVSQKLVAPQTVTVDGVTIQIGFIALPTSAVTYEYVKNTNNLVITPRRPALGQKATTFDLQMVTLFDSNLDDYTLEAMKSRTDDKTSTLKLYNAFRITVAPETEGSENVMSKNLAELLPGLVTNYYDYGKPIDLTQPIKDNLHLPSLTEMSDAGIFDYDGEQMQYFESLTKDVAEVSGYNIVVYRPLPGEEAAEAQIKVQICKREKDENGRSTPGEVLGETILTFEVEPLTEKEISDAKALLDEVSTENFYWESIRGENTDQNHITKDLHPFYKIVKNADGTYSYPTLGQVKNVEGIYTDDFPGYDPMNYYGDSYRTYFSSRHTILSYENLLLTQPEYNTEVTIKSWLTYTQYAKYYEKFVENAETPNTAYERFKTFYKREVSTTVKVDGKQNIDEPTTPVETKQIEATVIVDGRGTDGFVSNEGEPYTFKGEDTGDGITVARVMKDFFDNTDYSSESYLSEYGGYIYSITDPEGTTLEAGTEERPYSGWMYSRNGEYADAINAEFVGNGDEIYFYYTVNYYLELSEDSEEYQQYKMLADDVADKINAIPAGITQENAADYEKAVTVARNAFDALDEGIREYILDKEFEQKLKDAEAALEAFKAGNSGAEVVRAMIAKLPQASKLKPDNRSEVEKVYNAYLTLKESEKAQLTEAERQKLLDCMEVIRSFTGEEGALEQLHSLLESIQDETDVRWSEKAFVEEAGELYDGLSKTYRKLVSREDSAKLKAAQKSLTKNEKAADKFSAQLAKLTGEPASLTLKNRKTVTSVEKAYSKLTDGQKTFVSEADTQKLNAFIEQRDYLDRNEEAMEANEKAAAAVVKLIRKLPSASRIKYTDEPEVAEAEQALAAYRENLAEGLEDLVTNADVLTAARAAVDAAKEAVKDDIAAAELVIEQIHALPAADELVYNHDSTEDSQRVDAAADAYDELGKEGLNYIRAYDKTADEPALKKLKACQKAIKKLISQDTKDQKAAQKVAQKIAKLPEAEKVVVKNRKAIEAARTAFVRLSDNAKKYAAELTYVENGETVLYMTKLEACEAALLTAAENEEAAKAVETLIKKLPTAKRVDEDDRAQVEEAWQAYEDLSSAQQKLVSSKYVEKLQDCYSKLNPAQPQSIDVAALALEQEEIAREAVIIEQFVLTDDEDDEPSIEEDLEEEPDADLEEAQ